MGYTTSSPVLLVDTRDLQLKVNGVPQFDATGEAILDEQEWLKWRKNGIGGSDAATVLGISPWKSRQELADDKRGIAPMVEKTFNEQSKMIGHLTEEHVRSKVLPYLLAKVYNLKNFQIGIDTRMCRHGNPDYSMALADIDGWIKLEDGRVGIVEIKTTNWRNKATIEEKWKQGIVPAYYEVQVRHYMAVMNLDFAYVCCSWGLDPDQDAVVIRIDRNLEREADIMDAERIFWNDYVIAGMKVPKEDCDPAVALSYISARDIPIPNKKPVRLDHIKETIERRQAILDEMDSLSIQQEALKSSLAAIDLEIVSALGDKECGTYNRDDKSTVYVYAKEKYGRSSYDVEGIKKNYPDIYEKSKKETIIAGNLTTSEKAAIKDFKIPGEAKGEREITIRVKEPLK